AGIYALEHHIERLKKDHKKAREIAAVLEGMDCVKKVEPVETNIIIFEIDETQIAESDFLGKLSEKGVLIIGMGQGKLRIVTHLDYTDQMHELLLEILKEI
ncbi:MAG: threonine aldolase, partial [Bacteroidota bacterium]